MKAKTTLLICGVVFAWLAFAAWFSFFYAQYQFVREVCPTHLMCIETYRPMLLSDHLLVFFWLGIIPLAVVLFIWQWWRLGAELGKLAAQVEMLLKQWRV